MTIKLKNALELKENEVISLVGGGGKTTLLYWLAKELSQKGVILTTTTKMWYPPASVPLIYWKDRHQVQEILKAQLLLKKTPLVASGDLPQLQKIQGLDLEQIQELAELELAATMIIEADGAKGRPLKGYRDFEPVLTPLTTLLIQVVGADVIGQSLNDRFVHCPEKVAKGTGLQLEASLDVEALTLALLYPYTIWQKYLVNARRVVVINKANILEDEAPAKHLATKLLKSKQIDKVLLTAASRGQIVQVYDESVILPAQSEA